MVIHWCDVHHATTIHWTFNNPERPESLRRRQSVVHWTVTVTDQEPSWRSRFFTPRSSDPRRTVSGDCGERSKETGAEMMPNTLLSACLVNRHLMCYPQHSRQLNQLNQLKRIMEVNGLTAWGENTLKTTRPGKDDIGSIQRVRMVIKAHGDQGILDRGIKLRKRVVTNH